MSTFAVIYDVLQTDEADLEEYYGYFSSAKEAERMFQDAFGNRADVVNARLVKVEKILRA